MRFKKLLPVGLLLVAVVCYGFVVFANKPMQSPSFSHSSGFYGDSFQLEITAPKGCTVYYTLDGSIPDETSLVYNGPLLMENATDNQNVYSAIEGISVYQVVNVPDYSIDKCNVVRAVAVSPLGISSEVVTASYFVGIGGESYKGCNVVSVVTDPENLFDHHKGIYMLGAIFEDYAVNGDTTRYPFYWSANYNQRGMDWERPAYMEFFDSEGNLVLQKNGGMRIRGGTTRAWGKKGFNLFSRYQYDGSESFGTQLFEGYQPAAVSLMTGGNQPILQFHDYAFNNLISQLDVVTAEYKPYILFLDGEYWGFYWLAEKFDQQFFAQHYNVDQDLVVMIKNKAVEVGQDKDIALYTQLEQFVENTDMSVKENFEAACSMIDMESCLDYYASFIYAARSNDWPHYNVGMWRTRTTEDNAFGDGRWRFVIFDCNTALMGVPQDCTYEDNTLEFALEKSAFFRSLWASEEFRQMFRQKIFYIADNVLNSERTTAFADSYIQQMYPVLSENWNRFYTLENDKDVEFYASMEDIKNFFVQRRAVVESWFE